MPNGNITSTLTASGSGCGMWYVMLGVNPGSFSVSSAYQGDNTFPAPLGVVRVAESSRCRYGVTEELISQLHPTPSKKQRSQLTCLLPHVRCSVGSEARGGTPS